MFQLISSNSMTRLADVFIERASEIDRGPFEPQTVVVQSFGMGQWLKIRQAEQLGITANMDCILPANLIWRLYQALLPDFDLPGESPFSIERLTWHLMKRFPESHGEEFAAVRQFLDGPGDPQVRAYQLGEKIGSLFDQYLIYRPGWMNGWDAGEAQPESWQRTLWNMLNQEPALDGRNHRARLHAALLERLAQDMPMPDAVPRHIAVVGLSTLPPIHLEALQGLSRHIDVDLYFLNPCQHYWGDIVSEKDKARRSIRAELGKQKLTDDDYLEIGNPLLSSWGKQGREFLELLLDTDGAVESDCFEEPAGDSMLAVVKRDVLELTCGGEFASDTPLVPQPVASDDISIQMHVCHSKMREVEVLHDQLLRLFARNSNLRPVDVIVMSPDISAYAPFIEAVFGRGYGDARRDKLPFSITDQAPGEKSPVLVALTTLLSLPDLRLTSTEIMDLLEVPTISRRFGLEEHNLHLITRWIQDAAIRWELDGRSREERWQVPDSDVNTWRFGLDRLLLGFAMGESDGLFKGILPANVEGQEADVLGTLCLFIDQIAHYRAALADAHTAREWRELLLEMMEVFFDPREEEEMDLVAVRELLIRLEEETAITGFDEPLSPKLFRYWLDQQLSISLQSRGFISGGITFATLVPMRSIPFKAVCLLGMNDGQYPREDRPPTFDLMEREGYRRGDRSKRNDDRYLFMEALLSAEETFYVSYEGRSIRDNKERPPSVLVSELENYLTQVFERIVKVEHPLQPFSERYYQETDDHLVSFNSEWFEALEGARTPVPFISGSLAEEDENFVVDSIEQLKTFVRHPAKSFLRDRLGIYFDSEDIELEDAEPFTLDGLKQFGLTEQMIDAELEGKDVATLMQETRASGHVMTGNVGFRQLEKSRERAAVALEKYRAIAQGAPFEIVDECTLPSGALLRGHVPGCFGEQIVELRPSRMSVRRVLVAWVNHLFANTCRGPMVTWLLAIDSGELRIDRLDAVDSEEARTQLDVLVDLLKRNRNAPVPLAPETSHAWIVARDETGNWETANEKALDIWDSESEFCESKDSYYSRLYEFPRDFDDEFVHVARQVFGLLTTHWHDKEKV